ncbi:alpha/beta hydrolase [Tolypothrix sp. FACHB-123]|uniref:alpha/beta hydrolase n=1 Tax=Tolypothrix sp. FACHB-123 TaxID=2692868 RepID=UPI0016847BE3|nr:alpha/beta hydrolase [Tolypothrix sp. FACHB-123]MBD2356576.1 alpha/beta hydrolase [Tolypothrix sp. FACHB-123]
MLFQMGRQQRKISWLQGLLCSMTIALSWGMAVPATLAAQKVNIKLGPFQQSIAIADLETFAKTGKLPENLKIYGALLTPQVRELLNRRLEVDPEVADKFFDDLVRSPQGQKLIASLGVAIPGSTVEGLQAALNLSLRQVNGLSFVGFLRAYPGETVTVDATKAVEIAIAFNANSLQNQALSTLLERDLFVKNTTFKPEFDPAVIGKQVIQQQTVTLQDQQRQRTIPVDIYWSQGNARSPLVVLSHGFGANRRFFGYLARHLASHGVTVAAIEHPDSQVTSINRNSPPENLAQLLAPREFIERPKDISFLLNELAKRNYQSGELQGKFLTDNVTVIGHSLGGYTALALLGGEVNLDAVREFCQNSLSFNEAPGDWLQCAAAPLTEKKLQLKDARVKSAIAFNPLIGNLFGDKGLNQVTNPVLFLTSTEDSLTPALKHQIQPFSQLRGNKYLVTAIGGTHLSISDPTYSMNQVTTIVKEKRGAETNSLRQLTRGVTLAFVKQSTPEANIYQSFLTPAYAQSLSTPEIPLRLNSDLPGSIKTWLSLTANPNLGHFHSAFAELILKPTSLAEAIARAAT